MVGVPGRSKACNTCKKRRIACTLEKPQCAQCVKSNRVCGGYQRERIFIQNQEKVEDRLKASKQATSETTTRKKYDIPLVLRSKELSKSPSSRSSSQAALVKEVHPSTAFQQQLLSEFLYNWIPGSRLAIQQRQSEEENNWLMLLPDLQTSTKALEKSILAVCTAKLGRLYNEPVLVKESARLYGQGLWELQKALWDPKLMYKDETLAACMALSMYEIIECPTGDQYGWLTHSGGCTRLVWLRGPEAHTTPLGHHLFRSCRYATLIQCMSEHRFTYLADPEWLELPWKNSSKKLIDKLVDVFAKGANIMAQAEELSQLKSTNLVKSALQINEQCWMVDSQLREIYNELERNTIGPLYWPEFSTLENPADDPELGKVFPVAFHFLNLRMGGICVLYWTLCTILWTGLANLYFAIAMANLANESPIKPSSKEGKSDGTSGMGQLPPLEHRIDPIEFMRNICQSAEYCMQDDMGSMGPSTMIFPLQVVIETLKNRPQNSRELEWARATLEMINQRGFRILKSVQSGN